ncbi:hypothetical protein [Spirosoma linguale]|uniref:Uncharacterized protein n=1 Tax=Spirosoma linguale (strain ATCC 33905 / DSM 74 / LMG 10896 / Claus 1) TaxID=504472 RepID=D2QMC9_SPILD|nr:hypothetical protein Slin_3181 [Spirosoma linguale DSM 74]
MNRYSVVYMLKKQYYHISCRTNSEAVSVLDHLSSLDEHSPIGIYDAKTELFHWEPQRQYEYNRAQIDEQGKLADQIIQTAQALRLANQTITYQLTPDTQSRLMA